MELSQDSINTLRIYVEKNEVVYQVYGGPIELSNDENQENRKSLLEYFNYISSVEVYQKGASFIHEPFNELDNWATKDDNLFLIETIGVLICIPPKCTLDNKILSVC